MPGPRDLPAMVAEFVELAKAYLRQETLEPAKQLGRYGGMSLAAAVAWALATLLLGVALMRTIVDSLPEGVYWSALGYALAALAMGIFIALLVWLGTRWTERKTEP